MHAAAAQTAAASRPLILVAAACMICPGGNSELSYNSRRAQYMTPTQAGIAIAPMKGKLRGAIFIVLMAARVRHGNPFLCGSAFAMGGKPYGYLQ